MEHQDVSDYDEDSEEGPRTEVSSAVDETYAHKSGVESTTQTLTNAVVPVADTDYVAMEPSSEIKECVLCRRRVCVLHFVILLASQIKIILGFSFITQSLQ
jgi:hypothetical protein